MNKGEKYDYMLKNIKDDELGLFEKYEEILNEIREIILTYNAEAVLDIGCGTANLCGPISRKIKVIGIDKNEEMLLQAKKKYPKMSLKQGDFLDKPFEEEIADIIVTTLVFHAITNKKLALENMIKYLKPNGKIVIADYMFLNEEERENCKRVLLEAGKKELWDFINSKNYTNVEMLEDYVETLGYKFRAKHIINFTWLVEIEI
ncbi:class I SAM-dependent methyltransferase [Clostridium sp. 19966]|uniref:class I SAM-dependent methyltransferase n=1 Tax=Clostridium sp. 19966 TaxID=2768166 RepID=UPI0028DF1A5C|nr:class I SAM-dependent methyltransferase [Clostridium sp. 19966]MDT8717937.1 class I SAM-dependent methyltransferase [Clostridium sp. 19966]